MISNLDVTSRVCFDHFMNSWRRNSRELLFRQDYDGYKFPEEKGTVLRLIEEGLTVDESRHIDAEQMVRMRHL